MAVLAALPAAFYSTFAAEGSIPQFFCAPLVCPGHFARPEKPASICRSGRRPTSGPLMHLWLMIIMLTMLMIFIMNIRT